MLEAKRDRQILKAKRGQKGQIDNHINRLSPYNQLLKKNGEIFDLGIIKAMKSCLVVLTGIGVQKHQAILILIRLPSALTFFSTVESLTS